MTVDLSAAIEIYLKALKCLLRVQNQTSYLQYTNHMEKNPNRMVHAIYANDSILVEYKHISLPRLRLSYHHLKVTTYVSQVTI